MAVLDTAIHAFPQGPAHVEPRGCPAQGRAWRWRVG